MRHTTMFALILAIVIASGTEAQSNIGRRRAAGRPSPPSTPAPVATADSYNGNAGAALTIDAPGVLGNDTLNSGTIISYGATSGSEQTTLGAATPTAQGGSVTLNADGSFTYNPTQTFLGADTFRYVVKNAGGAATGVVTITVAIPAPDFMVTSPGFFYAISGQSGQNPKLTLTRGRTYTFAIDTDDIHPFEITGAPAGSVTNNNISSGTITFRVPTTAQNYRYICSIHGFGNTIETVP